MPRPFCLVLALLALLILAHPAPCQSTDFVTALSGDKHPLTLKLKDLDGSWRRFSLAKSSKPDIMALLAPEPNAASTNRFYYTRGETIAVGSVMFLVSYHCLSGAIQENIVAQGSESRTPPQTPNTLVTLSLINISQIGSLDNIQPFVLADVVTPTRAAVESDLNQISMSNLHQIGVAIVQYIQDHDEALPPMKTVAEADNALCPYINVKVFENPITHQRYQTNTSLVHRNLASVEEASTMVIYYEASPADDGKRAVLFLDGHVKRITEAEWKLLKIASHVPGSA